MFSWHSQEAGDQILEDFLAGRAGSDLMARRGSSGESTERVTEDYSRAIPAPSDGLNSFTPAGR